ncbi:MAG: 50S ribosomal protein L3 [Candidatus Shapirobacteria bacterium]|jgi:large subunit ribosomal protein L3
MISGFIAKKGPMTSVFTENGKRIGVSKLIAAPLTVTQIKTPQKDGYPAIQIAYGSRKKITNKAVSSKITKLKLDITPKGFKEFEVVSDQIPEIGKEIAIDSVFSVGDTVKVTGVTKGHGFSGVIKRHGFHRQPVSGGQSDRVRAPGSIGAQTPGKVLKGKKMPGHFGNTQKSVLNLKIVSINPETSEITLSGSVPGSYNSWVIISKS